MILSPIEQSIKRKIEATGTPLKNWNIRIYRGVLTGCNDAFIITSEKRDEILSKCHNEDERIRTEALIRPILRGRDIKRYSYTWANLWLIATFPSRHYKIDDYPAVRQYLESYGNGHGREILEQTGATHIIDGKSIKSRKRTGNKWFETQDSISYWEDFSQPKIVWAELARTGNAFVFDNSKSVISNTGYIMTAVGYTEEILYYLLGFLNSRIILFCLNQITSRFDENGWRWLRQFVEQLRIPPYEGKNAISELAKATTNENQKMNSIEINKLVACTYGLDENELNYIDEQLSGY